MSMVTLCRRSLTATYLRQPPLRTSLYFHSRATANDAETDKFLRDLGRNILREDNHVLVINKPGGVLAHSSSPEAAGLKALDLHNLDVLSAYKLYLKEKYDKPGNVYLQCINRLDQAASGVMVLARTSKATQRLNKAYHLRKVHKQYLCVVDGELYGAGIIPGGQTTYQQHWAGKSLRTGNLKRIGEQEASRGGQSDVDIQRELGRNKRNVDGDLYWHALSHCFDTEDRVKTVVGVKTLTGKKHQVRRQLAMLGFPIYGDSLYGSKSNRVFQEMQLAHTICLHAGILTKHKVIRAHAPVPRYWKKALLKGLTLPPPSDDYYDEERIARESEELEVFAMDQDEEESEEPVFPTLT